MYARVKKTEGREYLQIVESRRVDGRVSQRLVASLGRVDELRNGGQIDAIVASLAKYAEKTAVLSAHERGEIPPAKTSKIGPPLLFGRLWDHLGIGDVLDSLLRGRQYEFPVERAVFMTVVHRMMVSGSDRSADKWKSNYAFGTEIEGLDLHQLYRAMAWLGEPLPDDQQAGATPFSPRCVKDRVEELLFHRNRDLFSEFDLVFFDTTSIYFEGRGGQSIGQRGNSKDHRPDLKQMVVGVVLDSKGMPICCELWPGNTTDVTTLIPVVERLKSRFKIGRVCVVADRGMISKETIEKLESAKLGMEYILGARMRKMKEVRDEVLSRGGRYEEVTPPRRFKKDPSPLKVKEVWVGEHRYVVCHNDEEERKDKMDRAAIVASLREALKRGDKSLVGNQGYRRYIKSPETDEGFEIDEAKIEREERYDGKWVLRTNTKLPAAEVALKYKQLWMVEQAFRTLKSILENRPVFHKWDETIRGHVFCSFLGLVLMKHVLDVMEQSGIDAEWADLKRDLESLEEIELEASGKRFVLRSEAKGAVGKLFQAARVALPPNIRQVKE